MIHRRLAANLKAQNWTAIAIDFVLLVLGVFLGVLAANWNQQRLENRETGELLVQLGDQLSGYEKNLAETQRYYDVPARYTDIAFRAWNRDPSVSDREFVIAAYQASQVTGAANDGTVMAQMFGADRLRTIKNTRIRLALSEVIGFDKIPLQFPAVQTPYRQHVRSLIPDIIQQEIRTRCGDRFTAHGVAAKLPAQCNINIPPELAAETAAILRANPRLKEELQWHRAAVATQLFNMEELRLRLRNFLDALAKS